MIIDKKTLYLFGKETLNKLTIQSPFEIQNTMVNEACLLYVIKGEQTSISQTEIITATKGEAILLKCGNYLNKIKIENNIQISECITIHLRPDILKLVYDNELPKYLKPVENSQVISNITKIKGDILINKYFESLLFYFENQELVDNELLKLKIKELILLLVKTKNNSTLHSILSNLFTPRIYTLREIVTAHLYSTISINQLAKLCAFSRSTFIREFKKEYKQTPSLYLKNKKLERATHLLKFSSESISNIA